MITPQRKGILSFSLLAIVALVFVSCEPKEEQLVYKPNIYIYPEENLNLQVYLDFPKGGKVVTSIPEYGDFWDISVDSTGIIDNYYRYLFYESSQPYEWQHSKAWLIAREDLKTFFEENLAQYGFRDAEIEDFIEYWIPRLTSSKYYSIFPQTMDEISPLINLTLSPKPDNIQRLFYCIHGSNQLPENPLQEPSIESTFEREGFFVVEWGVII